MFKDLYAYKKAADDLMCRTNAAYEDAIAGKTGNLLFRVLLKSDTDLYNNIKLNTYDFDSEKSVDKYIDDLCGEYEQSFEARLGINDDAMPVISPVPGILCNDDWGFIGQTMVPPDMLRKLVFPWYKQIVARAHAKDKYAILHSCGCYTDIIEDIIEYIKFDGRHSYEDKIVCVEKAYSELYPRIAVMGGIDVDFLARSSADNVYRRCRTMLTQSASKGGYALGSGNSVPDYIPDENYIAILRAGNEDF